MSKYNDYINAKAKLDELTSEGLLQDLNTKTEGYIELILNRAEIIIREGTLCDFNQLHILKLNENDVIILASSDYAGYESEITIKQEVFEMDEKSFKEWIDDIVRNKEREFFEYKIDSLKNTIKRLENELLSKQKELSVFEDELKTVSVRKEVYIPKVVSY